MAATSHVPARTSIQLSATQAGRHTPRRSAENARVSNQANMDTFLGPSKYFDGFHILSEFMSSCSSPTTSIFRRFDRLAIRNLLYLESELSDLEAQPDRFDGENVHKEEIVEGLKNWPLLCRMAVDDEPSIDRAVVVEAAKRVELVHEIRNKLREYHESLKMTFETTSLPKPDQVDFITMRRVFDNFREKGIGNEILKGAMATHLDHRQDLCALEGSGVEDMFTAYFQTFVDLVRRAVKTKRPIQTLAELMRDVVKTERPVDHSSVHKFITKFQNRRWEKATIHAIVTLWSIASLITYIVAAVVGLYYWESRSGRLILLSGFTFSFAVSITVLTQASRQEIYATTAAYAAVLVVFIGSAISPNDSTASGSQNQATTTQNTIVSRDTGMTSVDPNLIMLPGVDWTEPGCPVNPCQVFLGSNNIYAVVSLAFLIFCTLLAFALGWRVNRNGRCTRCRNTCGTADTGEMIESKRNFEYDV